MSFLYTDFANGLWDPTANTLGRVDVLSDPLALLLIETASYIADQDGDVSLADIPGGAIAGNETPSGITVINRVLTFDPVTFPLVPAGPAVAACVLIHDTGTAATSALIAYLDDFASGMPITPDGTDIEIDPDALGLAVF